MKYLNWLKLLPTGSSVWAYLKVLVRLLVCDVMKTLERVWTAIGWGFGLTFGFYLFQAVFNSLIPVAG